MQNEYLFFARCFFLVGIFALMGSLYTWGEGWIMSNLDANMNPLIIADLLLTGPFLLMTSLALYRQKSWAIQMGMVSVGILLLGSLVVYIDLWLDGPPYLLHWALPPLLGLLLAASFWFRFYKS